MFYCVCKAENAKLGEIADNINKPGIEKKQLFQHYLSSILAVPGNEFSTIQEIMNRSNSLSENKIQLNNRLTTALKTKEQEVLQYYIIDSYRWILSE